MSSAEKIKQNIAKLPDSPGVYLFKTKSRNGKGKSDILYIGKATSLRDRVRSYFRGDIAETRGPLIVKMLSEFDKIDHIKTDSVLEALILEAHLIKKYQPEANIKEKDNKSFNFVVITKEDFPRVLTVRGRELLSQNIPPKLDHTSKTPMSDIGAASISKRSNLVEIYGYKFGPFPNGTQLKEALKLVRKLFPFRDKCTPCVEVGLPQKGRRASASVPRQFVSCKPCFNRQIGLCPGVCSGEITKEEYAKQIKNIVLFFEGNKKSLTKNLEKQMKDFAKAKKFESAGKVKKTIFALNHIQDVSLIKDDFKQDFKQGESSLSDSFRIESYDIAHMSGQNVVGVMTVIEDGEINKAEYRKFKIKENPGVDDTRALKEVLSRRLGHIEWRMPNLIVVDGGAAQKNIIEKVLKENHFDIPVVSVVKDERHKAREILGDRSAATSTGKKWTDLEREILLSNAEAHRYAIAFHKSLRKIIR